MKRSIDDALICVLALVQEAASHAKENGDAPMSMTLPLYQLLLACARLLGVWLSHEDNVDLDKYPEALPLLVHLSQPAFETVLQDRKQVVLHDDMTNAATQLTASGFAPLCFLLPGLLQLTSTDAGLNMLCKCNGVWRVLQFVDMQTSLLSNGDPSTS